MLRRLSRGMATRLSNIVPIPTDEEIKALGAESAGLALRPGITMEHIVNGQQNGTKARTHMGI